MLYINFLKTLQKSILLKTYIRQTEIEVLLHKYTNNLSNAYVTRRSIGGSCEISVDFAGSSNNSFIRVRILSQFCLFARLLFPLFYCNP